MCFEYLNIWAFDDRGWATSLYLKGASMNWQTFWQKKSLGNVLLLPLSGIFYAVSTVRRALYQRYWAEQAPLPVIVIGNINIGGAGKTPLVIALGQLLAQHGIRYAVVSKGYGGSYSVPTIVQKDDTASVVGDEPLLIKLKTDCPVVVAQSRIDACRIVAEQFPQTQLILTDDGLQHYQLARDINVCVVNAKVGLGNGFVLPAGGLREAPSRLKAMDFVVYNGDTQAPHHYLLAERGWYHIHSGEKRYPDEFSSKQSDNLALSGIAHPELFFERLEKQGIRCETLALPDHYALKQEDLPSDKTLLMTEKDWVKAKALQHSDTWFLATEAVLSEALEHDFLQAVEGLILKNPAQE